MNRNSGDELTALENALSTAEARGITLRAERDAADTLRIEAEARAAQLQAERDELARKLEQAQRELESYRGMARSLSEALNSGDGSYRP